VAGVWAVAATAVALIALLDNSQDEAAKRAGDAETRSADVERKLNDRVDELETRLEDVPRAGDVSNLQERLKRTEERVGAATEAGDKADTAVNDLEGRIEQLERDAKAAAANTSGGGSP